LIGKYIFKGKEKQGRYDFVLNNHNKIIETDGGWHNTDNNKSGQTKEDSKFIDTEKDRLAEEHNIEVIRIDCNYGSLDRLEYVKQNILNNKQLNQIFDLSKIDWNKAEEFTCGNLIKRACEIKRQHPELNTFDIGEIMKFSHTTITSWLSKGHKYGWCEYDTRKIMQDIGKKNGKLSSREIRCTTTGEKFPSINYCSENSLKIFGIKIDSTNISAVCRGVRWHTQGYHFEYVEMTEEEMKNIKQRKETLEENKKIIKPIICLNNGIVIPNVTQCAKDSEKLFGINLSYPSIYKICNNKQKETKGFTFKYIKDLSEEEYIKYDIENKLKELKLAI
jgi:very-short-patch-repair endonuclease